MNIFLDFDGTLVDISNKYWWVYSEFFRLHGGREPDRENLWQAKRDGASDASLLEAARLDPRLAPDLKSHIQRHVETDAALELDRVFPGTESLLDELRALHALVLISARKNPQNLVNQIRRLGLDKYFAEILTASDESSRFPDGHTAKSILLTRSRWLPPGTQALIAGDAAMDIYTGKALGIKTCAVLSGIRSRSFLERLQPDHILDSVHQLPGIVGRIGYKTAK